MRVSSHLLLLAAAASLLSSADAKAVFSPSHRRQAPQAELTANKKAGGKTWQQQMLFRERLIAGAAARGTAQTFLHPIDVIRTRLQAKGVAMDWSPQTFVKGFAPQAILAMPAGALQFAAFEFSKAKCAAIGFQNNFAELLCGALGAMAASVIRVPQEVLKQRVQADIYPNALVGFQRLMASEGPRGLYKGYLATISRDVPWNALTFMFFAQAKALFKQVTGDAPDTQQNLVLGALAGMTAAIIMTPVDVVKTRLMTGGASGGIVGTFQAILKDEGAATLMKGVLPRVAFLAPMAAMTLALYEAYARQLISMRLKVPAAEL
jgi:solute carrier family 25 S-adenosylmethionine transporter 26